MNRLHQKIFLLFAIALLKCTSSLTKNTKKTNYSRRFLSPSKNLLTSSEVNIVFEKQSGIGSTPGIKESIKIQFPSSEKMKKFKEWLQEKNPGVSNKLKKNIKMSPKNPSESYIQEENFKFEYAENPNFELENSLIILVKLEKTMTFTKYFMSFEDPMKNLLEGSRLLQRGPEQQENSVLVQFMATWLPNFKSFETAVSWFYFGWVFINLLLQVVVSLIKNKNSYRGLLGGTLVSQILTSLALINVPSRGVLTMLQNSILIGKGRIWGFSSRKITKGYEFLGRKALQGYFSLNLVSVFCFLFYIILLCFSFSKNYKNYSKNARRFFIQCRAYPSFLEASLSIALLVMAKERGPWLIIGALWSLVVPFIVFLELIFLSVNFIKEKTGKDKKNEEKNNGNSELGFDKNKKTNGSTYTPYKKGKI